MDEVLEVIEFECSECEKSLCFGIERAGKRGKCPGCSTPFIVPFQSGVKSDPKSSKMVETGYPAFDQCLNDVIQNHLPEVESVVVSGNKVLLTFVTGLEMDRHQTLMLGPLELDEFADFLDCAANPIFISTNIGEALTATELKEVLQYAIQIHHSAIVMDEDWLLSMKRLIPDLNQVSTLELAEILKEMAFHSDHIEEILFGQDKY